MKIYDEIEFLPYRRTWEQESLYTNICLGTIPVMPHFNGQKDAREHQWTAFWVQSYGKSLIENSQRLRGGQIGASIWKKNERTRFIGWDALCPANYTEELFRGSELSLVR
ncbi:uncharacterized protein M437DRAFT_64791 [Aureobasidium melanogenum CBS 110374]|uniref:Uncharacterized protein n=1 Tax=Aureobasidium melanogenum (strain CBS 110374) TaxID=1043003 RepID=A0A074VUW2_AURM1|nr:uncharacterized protein M437DRAFT_64791 [Aureobasidium melanogenum CBS 110374]KEQ64238.1 hypothetical protein M437DRAFT_64791 [Aureobasidium melanogenum CBS 110374]